MSGRSTLKRWAAVVVVAATGTAAASCTSSGPEQGRASEAELEEIADEIERTTGTAAAVSDVAELGLVVIATSADRDPDDVIEDACQVILGMTDGPSFSFLVVNDDGTPRWYGTVDNLERCPPR